MACPVCAITGGSSGVGLATAVHFAQQGWSVGICGRDSDRLATAQTAIEEHLAADARCVSMPLDLGDAPRAASFVDFVEDELGGIDALVNNAAEVFLLSLLETRDDDFEQAINVNVRAPFYLTRRVWRSMIDRGGGVIVNVSSLAAIDPFPGFSIYGSCKAWKDLFTRALAAEGKPHDIRVFSVRAGTVETPLLRRLFPDYPRDETLPPQAVAELIGTLCSEPMRYTSGESIVIKR